MFETPLPEEARATTDVDEGGPVPARRGILASRWPLPPSLGRWIDRSAPLEDDMKQARTAARLVLLALVVAVLMAGCTSTDTGRGSDNREAPGGAVDLPGPLPQGVAFREPPKGAITAPDFTVDLLDETPVTADELWDDRPLVMVFTASWCDSCADVHRDVAEVVDGHDGAIGLLGVVREDDVDGAREYAQDLELGSPIAVGDESVWLHYAADEPPLVVLIAAGGKVLRGWPGGIDADDLAGQLEKLYEKPAVEDQ